MTNLDMALELDRNDPLARFRDRFHIPTNPDGRPCVYLCGNSLGLQPKGVRALIEQELDDWARLGVEGHFKGHAPWYSYHEQFRETGARLVGARQGEVVFMNSLTVNLHLLMATFYRPAGSRTKLLIDGPVFPSDLYAVASHVRHRSLEPQEHLLQIAPAKEGECLAEEEVEELLDQRGREIAFILLNGVNFLTGQWLDMRRLTAAAHRHGCLIGWDLAHAAGNVPLQLHDWDVDCAAWCSYKYLNAGPGAVAGVFIHEKHGKNTGLPRLAGWWGNDPVTRFRMQLEREFVPRPDAEGWQVSNPPIFSMAPLRASLELFDEASMSALREKSEKLTGYLEALLGDRVALLTPREPARRGCQLSLRIPQARATLQRLEQAGIVCDFREPDVLRVAPVPLYNTYEDVWRFAQALCS